MSEKKKAAAKKTRIDGLSYIAKVTTSSEQKLDDLLEATKEQNRLIVELLKQQKEIFEWERSYFKSK